MKPQDVIDSVRALGRLRMLEKDVFMKRAIVAIEQIGSDKLTPIQIKGLKVAAASVGLNSFSV